MVERVIRRLSWWVAMAVVGVSTSASQSRPAYTVTDLGLIGGSYSHGRAIDNAGRIGGDAQNPVTGKELAFRTDGARPIDGATDLLGTLGGSYSITEALNDLGQAAGYSAPAGDLSYHAFLTAPNATIDPVSSDLGTLSGRSNSHSWAHDVNDSGQVVGVSDTTNRDYHPAHPFRTQPNSAINPATDDLGTLGGDYGEARGINNAGIVVGFTTLAGEGRHHAFRTAPNAAINPLTDDLGTFGGSSSVARAINEERWVVGSAQIADNAGWRAFLLPPGETLDVSRDNLGTLGGDSHAIDLNAGLFVVGVSRLADDTRHAFVHDGQALYDLNHLIPANSGWMLNEATAINDEGLIVGTGTYAGQTRGFLLVPGPPPIIPADLDDDGDVDLDDFEIFQACASGPEVVALPECTMADMDDDEDVDQLDFAYFQRCYSGPDMPVIGECVRIPE